ncbi:MAG TPA: hypothetical protein VFX25_06015 [Streptosporangiaceae bacterium]|nr:hypothetical protein [Streptosporangiaceae bacterium]
MPARSGGSDELRTRGIHARRAALLQAIDAGLPDTGLVAVRYQTSALTARRR